MVGRVTSTAWAWREPSDILMAQCLPIVNGLPSSHPLEGLQMNLQDFHLPPALLAIFSEMREKKEAIVVGMLWRDGDWHASSLTLFPSPATSSELREEKEVVVVRMLLCDSDWCGAKFRRSDWVASLSSSRTSTFLPSKHLKNEIILSDVSNERVDQCFYMTRDWEGFVTRTGWHAG